MVNCAGSRPGARRIAASIPPTGFVGEACARMSKPPPNLSGSSNAFTNEPVTTAPTTSVKTTSVNIANVTPVRKRFRSG
jgi:hypothetical protein